MDFFRYRLLDQVDNPVYHVILNENFYNAVSDGGFLQNGEAESLSDGPVVLFFKDLYDSLDDYVVIIVAEVFNAP